jgi:hypothetical protein
MLAVDASNDEKMLGHDVVKRNRMVHLEDIRRFVRHGVLREEDGWAREEEERTMRREEEEEDAKSRSMRCGTAMGHPMLGVVRRNSLLERGGGARDHDRGGGNGKGGEHGQGARRSPTCGRKRREGSIRCRGKGRTIPVRRAGIRIAGGTRGRG